MEDEGTDFRCNVNVGVDITAEQLREEFDAVVLAGGATAWRDLPIEGRQYKGVYQAMEFLPLANRVQEGDLDHHPIDANGKHVVIIGGGDTGADCLGTSHRQGARSVHQFEIMPRPADTRPDENPWPTWPLVYRTSSAHEEGGERVYAVNTLEFLGDDDGNLRGLRAVEVRSEVVDGRPSFVPVEGSEFELECQLVFLAMGFVGPEQGGLLEQLGVDLDAAGQRGPRRPVVDQRRRRVRRRRHGPRPEPHRVGHRRGPLGRSRGRPPPHGRHPAAVAAHPGRRAAALSRPGRGRRPGPQSTSRLIATTMMTMPQ